MEKKGRQRYKLKNWSTYNQALINRDSLMIWFDESAVQHWDQPEKTGYRGSPMTYSEMAIQCALTLREVFKLTLPAMQGFLLSLIQLFKIDVQMHHYSMLIWCQQALLLRLPRSASQSSYRHCVLPSIKLPNLRVVLLNICQEVSVLADGVFWIAQL